MELILLKQNFSTCIKLFSWSENVELARGTKVFFIHLLGC